MPGRPSIPLGVVRAVLIEAGHRCAVCGTPCPLEKAHIVSWCRKRSHEQENLICLCANCHQRADHENWGQKTLREYKQKPWVMRQTNAPLQIDATKRIELIIDMEIVDFDGNQENILKHALAGLLGISPQTIRVRSKEKGSVKITLDLPETAAKELLRMFEENSPELKEYLPMFSVIDIREPRQREVVGIAAGMMAAGREKLAVAVGEGRAVTNVVTPASILSEVRLRGRQILSHYNIPAHDAEDLVREALISTLQKWDEIKDPQAWFLVTLRNRCLIYWRNRRSTLYSEVDTAILKLLSEPIASQERSDLMWDLDSLLEELPPRCRELLRLRYELGYDSKEAAEQIGYHPASVQKVTRRCIAALTKAMLALGWKERE